MLHKEHLSTTLLKFRDRKVHQTLLLSRKRAASNKIGTANPITVIFKICTVLIFLNDPSIFLAVSLYLILLFISFVPLTFKCFYMGIKCIEDT